MTFRRMTLMMALTVQVCAAVLAHAGTLNAPAPPGSAGSAMYTASDLYHRLTTGASGAKRTGPFAEPAAPPGATGRTINEIMAVAPRADNVNGAGSGDVASGKTFWGLRTDGAWGPVSGAMPPGAVPRTGQTACYAALGEIIACGGTGQDGAWRKGVAPPTNRFQDNNNGTVTDAMTGLIWLKNANCTDAAGGIVKTGEVLTWDEALTWSNNLADKLCGLSDGSTAGQWRLPNARELQSLLDFGTTDPPLPTGHPFTNVQTYLYWTATTRTAYPDMAWFVGFSDGYTDNADKATNTNYVWPVRGGR